MNSKMEDQFIENMPDALLELYEMAFTLKTRPDVTGLYKEILVEKTEEYKKEAFEVAKKRGTAKSLTS